MSRPKLSAFPKCFLEKISFERAMTVFEWIDMAKSLPCQGLEMYEGFFVDISSNAEIDRVAEAIRTAGFAMPMLCCSPDFTHPDPAYRQKYFDMMSRRIEVARRLGGPGTVCRVLSGQRRPDVSIADGVRWVVESIQQLLPVAKENQVVLGMENHYKDGHWQYPEFAQLPEVFYQIIDQIKDPSFGVQYDPSNAVVAGADPVVVLDRVKTRVVSMHASDRYLEPGHTLDELRQADGTLGYSPILKHGVTGKGLNDYDAIFRRLVEVKYTGWISIEDGMDGLDQMADSLRFLQRKVDQFFPAA